MSMKNNILIDMENMFGDFGKMQENIAPFVTDPKDMILLLTLWDCVEMIERYHPLVYVKKLTSDTATVIEFQGQDMEVWKKHFYKELVETDIICDNKFCPEGDINKNYGIGEDGIFYADEFINFRYQLYQKLYDQYKKILMPMITVNPLYTYVMECADMLKPYLDDFQSNVNTRHKSIKLKKEDHEKWKKVFLPILVDSSLLEILEKDENISGPNLQYFMSECYRLLLLPIHCNEKIVAMQLR